MSAAKTYVRELYDPSEIEFLRLEEVELSDDRPEWKVTLSFVEQATWRSAPMMGNLNTIVEKLPRVYNLAEGSFRNGVFRSIAALPERYRETYVRSLEAVVQPSHRWLGLSDATIVIAGALAAEVLTTDGPLCEALWRAGIRATNFSRIREQDGDL